MIPKVIINKVYQINVVKRSRAKTKKEILSKLPENITNNSSKFSK